MNSSIDDKPQDDAHHPESTEQAEPQRSSGPSDDQQAQSTHMRIDVPILAGITFIALLARIVLATQLDMVTDEVVYILGGKIYLPLITHLQIGAQGWSYNYEHPPLVKLLIGLTLAINNALGHPVGELLAARLPSILAGTALVAALYWLGKSPFGRVTALLAALCLAVSPWLVYFSALAYLDMTMTALITIAYLLLWHAIQRPWLYPISALLVGLGAASKYTAVLIIPGMILFLAYYYLLLRRQLPAEQRPAFPWHWWLAALALAPLAFLIVDPAIWPHPLGLLLHSFRFEWEHSVNGHLTFIAGQYNWHVPHWSILYIVAAKMSIFVTIPAACFAIVALVQLVRFHTGKASLAPSEAASRAFLLIWLLATLGMFSLLNIVVGTHYHLPMAPPVALAGASGLVLVLRYRRGAFVVPALQQPAAPQRTFRSPGLRPTLVLIALGLLLVGPHLIGLVTVHAAEGYTSEVFPGENATLQVAYPGYRDGLQWLATHSNKQASVGLVALPGTLGSQSQILSWFSYNQDMSSRFQLTETHPKDTHLTYNYLIWPMHLIQRGYPIPESWRSHVIYTVTGGNTIYCYVLANPQARKP